MSGQQSGSTNAMGVSAATAAEEPDGASTFFADGCARPGLDGPSGHDQTMLLGTVSTGCFSVGFVDGRRRRPAGGG